MFLKTQQIFFFPQGVRRPNQKLACSVLYLKIINTFQKMTYASYSKLSKELKNSIKI